MFSAYPSSESLSIPGIWPSPSITRSQRQLRDRTRHVASRVGLEVFALGRGSWYISLMALMDCVGASSLSLSCVRRSMASAIWRGGTLAVLISASETVDLLVVLADGAGDRFVLLLFWHSNTLPAVTQL